MSRGSSLYSWVSDPSRESPALPVFVCVGPFQGLVRPTRNECLRGGPGPSRGSSTPEISREKQGYTEEDGTRAVRLQESPRKKKNC